ncbi:MAG: glutamine-hydrolyzing GMP synthase [Firmicutes bacterium]|jgi:GMP synthase (glutamine-hydrolysing)|nr:glutamine-hydrolyzing GMP synthase [Bacillota bacterium]
MKALEKVIILDLGGRDAQQIARKIRKLKVYCEIMPYSTPLELLLEANPSALILSGGPDSIYKGNAPRCDTRIYALDIPVLGICYGMQLMAGDLGGEVILSRDQGYEKAALSVVENGEGLFNGLGKEFPAWVNSGAQVKKAPPGFKVLAQGHDFSVAAMGDVSRQLYGLQFRPDDPHTPQGDLLLKNFLEGICSLSGNWTMENFVKNSIMEIREKAGPDARAVCGLSGGIDSSVAAVLVHRALGERLTCIFVDHGLLRKGEKEQVLSLFSGGFKMKIIAVDVADEMLGLLRGVIDPEQKRKIIGNHFIRVFEREAEKLGRTEFLVQGTLYPDIIESSTATGAVIKSHHNVGGLPEDMRFSLIEPLKYLFKDEVRQVAAELGLPEEMVWRHPFPGPGLAVRVLGEVTPEKIAIVREADHIIVEEIKKAGLYRDIWQAFAVLPGIYSVGVKGDCRTYAHTIVLRAVTSQDGMTAEWYPIPYEVLRTISTRLVNEIPAVNRFVYDLTSKPPSTIEWE